MKYLTLGFLAAVLSFGSMTISVAHAQLVPKAQSMGDKLESVSVVKEGNFFDKPAIVNSMSTLSADQIKVSPSEINTIGVKKVPVDGFVSPVPLPSVPVSATHSSIVHAINFDTTTTLTKPNITPGSLVIENIPEEGEAVDTPATPLPSTPVSTKSKSSRSVGSTEKVVKKKVVSADIPSNEIVQNSTREVVQSIPLISESEMIQVPKKADFAEVTTSRLGASVHTTGVKIPLTTVLLIVLALAAVAVGARTIHQKKGFVAAV